MPQLTEQELKIHLQSRNELPKLLASNANYFGTVETVNLQPILPLKHNTAFEELGCIGYHPVLEELTATIKIKRSTGYGGNLCGKGSMEYVRFYLDYQDGASWQDMGMVKVNVHDIPDSKDCSALLEKPISYTVRLKIKPKKFGCTKPNLPKLRAVLSWNIELSPNQPYQSVPWGDAKEAFIQIEPLKLLFPNFPFDKIGKLLENVILNPTISLSSLTSSTPGGAADLREAQNALKSPKLELEEQVKFYNEKQVKIEPERIGAKILHETIYSTNPRLKIQSQNIFVNAKLDWAAALKNFLNLKGNVTYEELHCVGLDYHNEALIATLQVKKPYGYSGNLCSNGSKEYVAFWIQEEDANCEWKYIGTGFVNSHDINLPPNGLTYSVILPFDFSKYRKPCNSPKVLKVRAVLSWNVPPSTKDHTVVPYWGNIVDSYIQIAPGKQWDGKNPVMITLGGVSVDNINDISGLTKPGAKIEFNQADTYNNSPFGGVIVMQGLSDPLQGLKYRVKVNNLNTGANYYLNNALTLLGFDPLTNTIIHPVIYPDANGYYIYQPYLKNINSVLARFTPGTNDLLEITIEHVDGSTVSQRIQMDNEIPKLKIQSEKGGCGGYAKGDVIKGEFTASDNYILNYVLNCSVASNTYSGTTSVVDGSFAFNTAGTASPCGSINLRVTQKTIINSAIVGSNHYAQEIICLK